jgi:hypothetical protein
VHTTITGLKIWLLNGFLWPFLLVHSWAHADLSSSWVPYPSFYSLDKNQAPFGLRRRGWYIWSLSLYHWSPSFFGPMVWLTGWCTWGKAAWYPRLLWHSALGWSFIPNFLRSTWNQCKKSHLPALPQARVKSVTKQRGLMKSRMFCETPILGKQYKLSLQNLKAQSSQER